MDPRNTVAMKDGAFGSGWRPRLGISAVSKPTGRRSFFRRAQRPRPRHWRHMRAARPSA